MSSARGTNTLMDWRDITERLLDPQQRRAIVTKASTDELQQLKTKNAFLKRKRKIFDQIRKNNNLNKSNNAKNPDEKSPRSPNTSPPSSRCSELNFSNEEVPSTPPPTLPPANALPSTSNRSNHHNKHPHPSTARNASSPDSDSGPIDMGDYENRIRPSSAFWRKKDGMSLAEKIIYYRNWKYRNFPRREDNHQMAGETESTLTDHRRLRSTRQPAKSAATLRRRNSLEDDRQRPVTVIPKVTEHVPVVFPPIDGGRQVVVKSSHGATSSYYDDERDRLPSIEKNQFVTRSSPSLRSEKVKEEYNELKEYDVDDRKEETEAETEIDSVTADENREEKGEEEEEKPKETEEGKTDEKEDEEGEKPEEDKGDTPPDKGDTPPDKGDTPPDKGDTPPPEEPQNPDDKAQDESPAENETPSNPKSKKRIKGPRMSFPRAPRPEGQPDKLIKKLDKKVERDLRALQGQPNEEADDDDDTDVDDDTMNDFLHGERGKALDDFLKVS